MLHRCTYRSVQRHSGGYPSRLPRTAWRALPLAAHALVGRPFATKPTVETTTEQYHKDPTGSGSSAFFSVMLDRAKRLSTPQPPPPPPAAPAPPSPAVEPPKPTQYPPTSKPPFPNAEEYLDTFISGGSTAPALRASHMLHGLIPALLELKPSPRRKSPAFRNPALAQRSPGALFKRPAESHRSAAQALLDSLSSPSEYKSQPSVDSNRLQWAYQVKLREECHQSEVDLAKILSLLRHMQSKGQITCLWPSIVDDLIIILAAFDQAPMCETLVEALAKVPDHPDASCDALMELVFLYLRLGNIDQALVHYKPLAEQSRVLKYYKACSLSLRTLIGAYLQRGAQKDIDMARELVDEANQIGIKSHMMASNWFYLALAYFTKNQFDTSYQYLLKAIEHNVTRLPSDYVENEQVVNRYHILPEKFLVSAMQLLARIPRATVEAYEEVWTAVVERRFGEEIPPRYLQIKSMFYDKKLSLNAVPGHLSHNIEAFRRQYLNTLLKQLSSGQPAVWTTESSSSASTALVLASQLNHTQVIHQLYSDYGTVTLPDGSGVFSLMSHLEAYLALRATGDECVEPLLARIIDTSSTTPRTKESVRTWSVFFVKLVKSDPQEAIRLLKQLAVPTQPAATSPPFALDRLFLQVVDKLSLHPKHSHQLVMDLYEFAETHRIPLRARTIALFVATHIEMGSSKTALGLLALIDRMLKEFTQLNESVLAHPQAPAEYVLTIPEYPIAIPPNALDNLESLVSDSDALANYIHSFPPPFRRPAAEPSTASAKDAEAEKDLEDAEEGSHSGWRLNERIIETQEQVRLKAEELNVQAWALRSRSTALAIFNEIKVRPLSSATYFALVNSCLETRFSHGVVTNLLNLMERNKVFPTVGNITRALDICLSKAGNDDLAMHIHLFGVKHGVLEIQAINVLLKHAFTRPMSFTQDVLSSMKAHNILPSLETRVLLLKICAWHKNEQNYMSFYQNIQQSYAWVVDNRAGFAGKTLTSAEAIWCAFSSKSYPEKLKEMNRLLAYTQAGTQPPSSVVASALYIYLTEGDAEAASMLLKGDLTSATLKELKMMLKRNNQQTAEELLDSIISST